MARQEPRRQRRRAGSVDVIVAEHRDGLRPSIASAEARRGLVHVAQVAWVRHQRFELRIEEHRHVVEPDAAGGEHATQQLRQAVALAYRRGRRLRVPQEAFTPDESACASRHTEKRKPLGAAFARTFCQTCRAQLSPPPCRPVKSADLQSCTSIRLPKRPETAQAPTTNRGLTTYVASMNRAPDVA